MCTDESRNGKYLGKEGEALPLITKGKDLGRDG
jgi:hypothetical protein